MDDKTMVGWFVTILVALMGFIGKYWNDLRIAERKDRLDRINAQLRDLYGPLFALERAASAAWDQFRKEYRPGKPFFGSEPPPTERELMAWRLWMAEVFMPMNLRMETVVLANCHLMLEGRFPESFHKLLAHVASYKPLLKNWAASNFSEHVALIEFPSEDLQEDLRGALQHLQEQQQSLLKAAAANSALASDDVRLRDRRR